MAKPNTLAIGAAIKLGWQRMKTHFFVWVGILVVVFVVSTLPQGVIVLFNQVGLATGLFITAVTLAAWIVQVVLQIGIIKNSLVSADGGEPRFALLFSEYRLVWRFLGGSIVYGFIVMVGMFLLVVPGIIWALKYQFFSYLIVDRNLGVFEALHESGVITRGVKWYILGLLILLSLINFLGALLFMVGLLATVPTTQIALAAAYRQLSPASQSAPGAAPAPAVTA